MGVLPQQYPGRTTHTAPPVPPHAPQYASFVSPPQYAQQYAPQYPPQYALQPPPVAAAPIKVPQSPQGGPPTAAPGEMQWNQAMAATGGLLAPGQRWSDVQ